MTCRAKQYNSIFCGNLWKVCIFTVIMKIKYNNMYDPTKYVHVSYEWFKIELWNYMAACYKHVSSAGGIYTYSV
jgi:hypothetical protein